MSSHSSLVLAPYCIPTFHNTAAASRLSASVLFLKPISLFLMCLACLSGHTVEEATTVGKSVISPFLSTFEICRTWLWNLSYAFYLCRFITFKIPFPTILEGFMEAKKIKIMYAICPVEHEVPEV